VQLLGHDTVDGRPRFHIPEEHIRLSSVGLFHSATAEVLVTLTRAIGRSRPKPPTFLLCPEKRHSWLVLIVPSGRIGDTRRVSLTEYRIYALKSFGFRRGIRWELCRRGHSFNHSRFKLNLGLIGQQNGLNRPKYTVIEDRMYGLHE
jgi:hypothetical protein